MMMGELTPVWCDRVPNAKEGRDDPTLDVYGMSGIPEKFLHLHGGGTFMAVMLESRWGVQLLTQLS